MTTLAEAVPSTRLASDGGDRAPVAAFGVLVVAWALAVAAVALWVVNRPPVEVDAWFFLVDVMVAVVYGGVGSLILSRRRHPVAWIFTLAAVGCGLSAFGWQYMLRAADVGGLPGDRLLGGAVSWGWVPGTLALVTVVPWLVREPSSSRPASLGAAGPGVGAAVIVGWLAAVTVAVTRLTDPAPWPDGEPFQPLGFRSETWGRFVEESLPWMFGLIVALGLIATVDVGRRWRFASERVGTGLGWLLIGSALMTLSFVPLVFPQSWFEGAVVLPTLTPIAHLLSQAFLPAATVVVVLRQRLWGLDLALNRTLVHSLLSGALIGVYVVIVLAADQVIPGVGAGAAIAAGAVAALVLPLRTWLQKRVDLLVLGAGSVTDEAIRRMGRALGGDDPHGPVAGVATHLAEAFRLGSVEVAGNVDGRTEVFAEVGAAVGPQHRIELVHGRGSVGSLVVTAPFGERLDTRTLRVIGDLAPLVAATVRLAVLNDESTRSGARLTEARVQERRILRRDLHDGLGPALAGIGLGLQAYRNLRWSDAASADALLDRLCEEVDRRVDDVRQLSRQLLPPVLDDLGLVAALGELSERSRPTGLEIHVEATELGELDPSVATTAYAIVSEALVNAQRHGRAKCARVAVARRAERGDTFLDVEITSDGVPIDPAAPAGVGIRAMRERATDLGGTFEISPNGDGRTVVRATLPCGATA